MPGRAQLAPAAGTGSKKPMAARRVSFPNSPSGKTRRPSSIHTLVALDELNDLRGWVGTGRQRSVCVEQHLDRHVAVALRRVWDIEHQAVLRLQPITLNMNVTVEWN